MKCSFIECIDVLLIRRCRTEFDYMEQYEFPLLLRF